MAITFPHYPSLGQIYVADNAVSYVWAGDRWNAGALIHNGIAVYTIDGGNASSQYIENIGNTVGGGGAAQ